MAFASSNVQKTTLGDLKVTYGDWSGSAGDTAGTIGVSGGRVYEATFSSQDSSGTFMPANVRVSVSTSGEVTTVSVYNLADVTAGRFLIVHK